jgi:hypothetical protein
LGVGVREFVVLPPLDGVFVMDNYQSFDAISAFDCDILRNAFRTSVIENKIAEDQWQGYAALLVYDFTGNEDVDPALLAWIVGK